MSAFDKVLQIIRGKLLDGHAIANQQNKLSLAIAQKEIKEMMEKNNV